MLVGRLSQNNSLNPLNGQDTMSQRVFECPYARAPLTKACEVTSCSFNMPGHSGLSKYYRRCFLNYVEKGVQNPNHLTTIEQAQFSKLSLTQKKSLIKAFFNVNEENIHHAQRTFYLSFFSILLQDILLELPRSVLKPVPYSQCAVCGVMDDADQSKFFYPKGGALPDGYGYCSWNCYQTKPPPILVLESILEVDFRLLVEHQDLAQVLKKGSVPLLTYWLFTGVPLT